MKEKQKRNLSIPDPTMGPFGFTIANIKTALSGPMALFKIPKCWFQPYSLRFTNSVGVFEITLADLSVG